VADQPATGRARPRENKTRVQEDHRKLKTHESKNSKEIDASIMERQNLIKENDKLRIVPRTTLNENVTLKHENEILLDQKQQLISMNMKLNADQRACQNLSRG
jgi:hypothetical protein